MKIRQERVAHYPASKVWPILSDFPNAHKFHPDIDHVEIVSDTKHGIGARRECHYKGGTVCKEEIIDLVEGESFSVACYDVSGPFRSAKGKFACYDMGPDQCRTEVEYELDTKCGVLGRFILGNIAAPLMRCYFDRVLVGLEQHCATGDVVTKETLAK